MEVEDTVARGTAEKNVGHTEIVDTVVQPAEPNTIAIKMMLHFKTRKEAAPEVVIQPTCRGVSRKYYITPTYYYYYSPTHPFSIS